MYLGEIEKVVDFENIDRLFIVAIQQIRRL